MEKSVTPCSSNSATEAIKNFSLVASLNKVRYTLKAVKNPSNTFLLLDIGDESSPFPKGAMAGKVQVLPYGQRLTRGHKNECVAYPHSNGMNVGMVDGHVEHCNMPGNGKAPEFEGVKADDTTANVLF